MTLKSPIPSFVQIGGYEAKILYRGQEKTCRICGRVGHMSKNCPEIRCFSCQGFNHVASDCVDDLKCLYFYEMGHTEKRCAECLEDERKEQENEKENQLEMEKKSQIAKPRNQEEENEKGNTIENWTKGDQGANANIVKED